MRRPRLLISLLILTSVLVDVVVLGKRYVATSPGYSWTATSLELAFTSLLFCQMDLVSIWLAFGRTPGPLRLTAAMALIVGLNCAANGGRQFLAFPIVYLMVFLASGLIARWLGLRVWNVVEFEDPPPLPAERRPMQFSILQLFNWTTAIAVVLAMLKSLEVFTPGSYETLLNKRAAASVIAHVALAWAVVWAALGRGRPRRRIYLMALTLQAVFAGFSIAVNSPRQMGLSFSMFTMTTVLLLASLYVVRVAGYRLAFRRVRTKPDAEPTVVQQ